MRYALTSKGFGAVTIDPIATKPIPMTQDELNHEIRWCEQWLDSPAATKDQGRRIAVRLRLVKLLDARTAWDQHVAMTPTDADIAHDTAVLVGGA